MIVETKEMFFGIYLLPVDRNVGKGLEKISENDWNSYFFLNEAMKMK